MFLHKRIENCGKQMFCFTLFFLSIYIYIFFNICSILNDVQPSADDIESPQKNSNIFVEGRNYH